MIFLNLLHMRDINTNFQLPTSKTVILLIIVVKWGRFYPLGGGGWGRGVKFPRSTSYEGHTYQFSASYLQDCDLTYNCSQMGAILPPEVLLGEGGWSRELDILDILHMRNTHIPIFSFPPPRLILHIMVVKWGQF